MKRYRESAAATVRLTRNPHDRLRLGRPGGRVSTSTRNRSGTLHITWRPHPDSGLITSQFFRGVGDVIVDRHEEDTLDYGAPATAQTR
jgi:hypothetical protein